MNDVLLLDWKALGPARAPAHEHSDVARLTIGCARCIERRVVDQIVANLAEWLDSSDPWIADDPPPLPSSPPTPWRLRSAYRQMRSLDGGGYDVHDVRGVLALWAAEHDR